MIAKTDEQRNAEWEARIDISGPIEEICRRLGFKNTDVAHIDFTPGETTVDVLLHNEHGSKYIDPDTREAAMETHTFKTRS